MILVTVGTQLGFDRLIRAMDALAPTLGLPVFAQIGEGKFEPSAMEWQRTIAPAQFDTLLDSATLIVSHAGTGSVLMAAKRRKPIVLLARRAAYGEHRNDHQLATVAQLRGRPGIFAAEDENGLSEALAEARTASPPTGDAPSPTRSQLLQAIETFLDGGDLRRPSTTR